MDVRTGKLITAGSETETGEPISAESAFNFHAWYRAISLIAQKAAAVPKYLYQPAPKGKGRELAESHRVFKIVNRRANEEQTAFQFWLQMSGHVASRGNGYAVIWRNPVTREPEEIIPLDPDKTYPVRKGGKIWYVTFPFGLQGEGFKEPAENILHFKGFGFDGLVGYPVWEVAANEIGLGRAQRKLESMTYKNSGRPSIILQTDMKLTDKTKDRVRNDWERLHVGLNNAGKTAVLDGGLKANPISMTPEALEQTGAAQMSLVAISNFTGVPVSKLGGAKTYANQEMEDRAFINDGLDFYLNVEDDESTSKLLTEPERDRKLIVISDREALLKPDIKTKFDVLSKAVGGRAIITPNEARDVIDYPHSEEEDADQLLTPLNMGKGGQFNQPKNPADNTGRPESEGEDVSASAAREAARFALAHATARMVKRIAQQAKGAAARGSSGYVDWLSTIASNRAVFVSEFSSAERFAAAVNESGQPRLTEAADYLLETLAKEYGALQDTARESTILAEVVLLAASQLARLPQVVVDVFID